MGKGNGDTGLVKLVFDIEDAEETFTTSKRMALAGINFGLIKDDPVFSYFRWTINSMFYVPKSSLEAHLDLKFLSPPYLKKIQELLGSKSGAFTSYEVLKKQGRRRCMDAPEIVHTAELTRELVQAAERKYGGMGHADDNLLPGNFAHGLLLPRREGVEPSVRIDQSRLKEFTRRLLRQYPTDTEDSQGNPAYSLKRQKKILRALGGVYEPRNEPVGCSSSYTATEVSIASTHTSRHGSP